MSSYGGGISSFIKNKAETLVDKPVVFDVLTFDDTPKKFDELIKKTGGKVYKISNPKKAGFFQFFSEVNHILSKQPKHVIIHSHINGMKALAFYLVAKKNGIKRFVIHAHTAAPLTSSKFKLKSKQILNTFLSSEKLSCGIKASVNIFGNRTVKRKKIVHIPNSINEEKFLYIAGMNDQRKKLRKDILDITGDQMVIGSVARFKKLKNHTFMLDIIEDLKKRNFNFIWFFAGDGSCKQKIEKEVHRRKLDKYVKFLGYRNDIDNLFNIMDIFALPSLYEGLPTVLIEAQASSTYSLVSNTVTDEADLDLGLVSYLDIISTKDWVSQIEEFKKVEVPTDIIKQKLLEGKFTAKTSADLYLDFLQNKIDSYYI